MLESSLTADKQSSAVETANEGMDEKGLTAEEEQNLDSIMKSLDFDDDDEGSSEFHFWPTLYTRLARLLFVVAYTTSHYKYVLLSICHNSID